MISGVMRGASWGVWMTTASLIVVKFDMGGHHARPELEDSAGSVTWIGQGHSCSLGTSLESPGQYSPWGALVHALHDSVRSRAIGLELPWSVFHCSGRYSSSQFALRRRLGVASPLEQTPPQVIKGCSVARNTFPLSFISTFDIPLTLP